MKRALNVIFITVVVSGAGSATSTPQEFVNGLRSMGYSLLPAAQKVRLTGREIPVDSTTTPIAGPESTTAGAA